MATDPTKQLAEKKAKKSQLAVGVPEPQPAPERGWGWFGDFVGDLKDAVTNPVATAKQMPGEFRRTFIDPIYGLGESINPFVTQSPMERVNKAAGGALAAADFLTPAIPEGAFATRASRQLASRMADAANSGRKYRGVLGVHGGRIPGLTQIDTLTDYNLPGDKNIAWFWDVEKSSTSPENIAGFVKDYAPSSGSIYVARFPRADVAGSPERFADRVGQAAIPNYSTAPGRVVAEIPRGQALSPRDIERALARTLPDVMRPSERRALAQSVERSPVTNQRG